MQGLADAARCRSESDWLIGINGTRALTKRMFGSRAGNVASVGRVQTPTLAIVYNRELEIRNFKPRGYWRVTAKFEIAKGDLRGRLPSAQLQEERRRARPHRPHLGQGEGRGRPRRLRGPARRLRHRGKEGQHAGPPRLYDLTTLQREANNRFGLPARARSRSPRPSTSATR
jgi:DNA topoisomerase-3